VRIHVLADVHLEGPGLQGLAWAIAAFTKPVIYVAGNHEFWSQHPLMKWWQRAQSKLAGTQVHLLENDSVIIDGVRFLGCTLWTDYRLFGDRTQQAAMAGALRQMNDFSHIFVTTRGSRHGRSANAGLWEPLPGGSTRGGDRLTPRKVLAMHQASRDFLERELAQAAEGDEWNRTVGVTHHAPSARSLLYGEPALTSDASYASHLDHLVAQSDLWIHGHVHQAREYALDGGGRVVVNCRGYADTRRDAVAGFAWDRVIEV